MSTTPYGQLDNWRDAVGPEVARGRERAASLELRGRAAEQIEMRAAYLDLLDIVPGQRVLEVGCGSGAVRDLARRVGAGGQAVGVDPSPGAAPDRRRACQCSRAQRGHRPAGRRRTRAPVRRWGVRPGARGHVAVPCTGRRAGGPRAAARNATGGRVAVFDVDADAMIISHPDRPLTRRIVVARSDHMYSSSWIARRLPGLFREAGLCDVRLRAFTAFDHDLQGWSGIQAERGAAIAVEVGAISEDERQQCLDQLRVEQDAGRFLAGLTFLFIWGTVPQGAI